MYPLRISLLSTHSCPWAKPGNRYTGGMNIYIQNLARELARRGHLIDIYTSSHYGDEQCRVMNMDRGVRLIHVSAADYSTVSESNLDKHVSEIAAAICSYSADLGLQYDLIHSHYWLSGLVGNHLKEAWNIPHITMFHTLAALKNNAGLGILEPEFRIGYEKAVINACNLIIASTEREQKELIDKYNCPSNRVSVIPCGIDSRLFKPIDRALARATCNLKSKSTAIFVGRMDPLKGLANLLKAIPHVKATAKFQLLVIGGEGKNEAAFRQMLDLIHDYGIEDTVIPVGSVPHEEMYLYYNSADFCIIPSFYESFSLVALESLACGAPVVSTDVGAVLDMSHICPGCQIMPDNSPATLSKHMEAILRQPQYDRIIDIEKLTSLYGWSPISERMICEYENMNSASNTNLQTSMHT